MDTDGKLGRWKDIEHELEDLTAEMYGSVQQALKRKILPQ